MKHVNGILGIDEASVAAAPGNMTGATVSVNISGSPSHVKSALKALSHKPSKSFGKTLTGQADKSVKAPKEPVLHGEDELDEPHPMLGLEARAVKLVDKLLS